MIGGERHHEGPRRARRIGAGFGQRPAHGQRRIVEEGQQRRLGLPGRVRAEAAVEIGLRQGARGLGPPLGGGVLRQGEELAEDHGPFRRL